ncbi:MAG: hypothetical protein HY711_11190 [Candidatus Melainabacteria bacterium]|nr:hypothetical protein [Candidatus Melainabacteria bacterium]
MLTLLPVINIVTIIATTGADCLSNDYLAYVGLIDQIFNGSYSWLNYFQDTFYRTHSVAIPVLVHLADAWLFHWNVYAELYLGVLLALLRLFFWHQALSLSLRGWLPRLMLPALALLIFSTSQISIFTYGDGTLTIGLSLLGFALGVWGLTVFPHSVRGPLLMLLGGLIASFSWGNGPVSWFVFLLALIALQYRKPMPYVLWLCGVLLSFLPYVLYLVLPQFTASASAYPGTSIVSLFNWRFIINTLGWPFTNNIATNTESLPAARAIGWTGIALATVGLVFVVRSKNKQPGTSVIPSLLFIVHGLLSIWQISLFRSLIAPWYTAVAMTFWAGLFGLACQIFWSSPAHSFTTRCRSLAHIWCFAVFLFMALICARSNVTYEDKSNLLFARAPASAAALRNYRTAPTYAEQYLFQWGVGHPELVPHLAYPLERHHLSVFAPTQEVSLQGDFLLDTVRVHKQSLEDEIFWTSSLQLSDRLPWYHYKHLNLLLSQGSSISWTISIAPNVQQTDFYSAVAVSQIAPKNKHHSDVSFKVFIQPQGKPEFIALEKHLLSSESGWHPIHIPLTLYKGQTITLRLASEREGSTTQPGLAAYRYPFISSGQTPALTPGSARGRCSRGSSHCRIPCKHPALKREGVTSSEHITLPELQPSNTDLSRTAQHLTVEDLNFDVTNPHIWKAQNMSAHIAKPGQARLWKLGNKPKLTYTAPVNARLSNYSHFWIQMAATTNIKPRALTVYFLLTGHTNSVSFQLPLLADGEMHSYTYDLKLLGLRPNDHLAGLNIEPVAPDTPAENQLIEIASARLVRLGKHS